MAAAVSELLYPKTEALKSARPERPDRSSHREFAVKLALDEKGDLEPEAVKLRLRQNSKERKRLRG